MMLAMRQVARKLHERFNEQNGILNSHTSILREIASSQKDMASTLNDVASTLRRIEKAVSPHSKSNAAEDWQD